MLTLFLSVFFAIDEQKYFRNRILYNAKSELESFILNFFPTIFPKTSLGNNYKLDNSSLTIITRKSRNFFFRRKIVPDLRRRPLEFVQIVRQLWNALLQALAFARFDDHLRGASGRVEGVAGQNLPVVEHALRKRLTPGV